MHLFKKREREREREREIESYLASGGKKSLSYKVILLQ